MEKGPNEKEEENYNPTQNTNNKEETMMIETELEMDQEMTQSETNLEDRELQEILYKEHLDLEGFLKQGTTVGIDSLPKDEYNRIQQLFLRKTEQRGLDKGKISDMQECRGVKTMKSSPGLATRNARKKRGIKKKKELLMECGKLMIDLGKIKDLTRYSFTNI